MIAPLHINADMTFVFINQGQFVCIYVCMCVSENPNVSVNVYMCMSVTAFVCVLHA